MEENLKLQKKKERGISLQQFRLLHLMLLYQLQKDLQHLKFCSINLDDVDRYQHKNCMTCKRKLPKNPAKISVKSQTCTVLELSVER